MEEEKCLSVEQDLERVVDVSVKKARMYLEQQNVEKLIMWLKIGNLATDLYEKIGKF